MRTSNFATYKAADGVSIALKSPTWFSGESYPDLFPKWLFLNKYFRDHDEDAYIKEYHAQVLSKLDPQKVLKDLDGNVLLCWERKGVFCHRRLVAEWLEKSLGVEVAEI